mmetsp:Transcript_28048/g.51262  ORF Transcript_28048/g.51262 Transcript_28048/m.51262 type:complete len:113 (-) Transcript_28048:301-639(-)
MAASSFWSMSINFLGNGFECPLFDEDEDDEALGVLCGVERGVDRGVDPADRRPPPLLGLAASPFATPPPVAECGDPNEAMAGEASVPTPTAAPIGSPPPTTTAPPAPPDALP